jgi:hypothetical protein
MSRFMLALALTAGLAVPSQPAQAKAAAKQAKAASTQQKAPTPNAEMKDESRPGLFSAYGAPISAQPGEILDILPTGQVRFFIGSIPIQVNEELRLEKTWGQSAVFFRVISVDPPTALAEVKFINVFPHAILIPLQPGQKIVMEVRAEAVKTFGFHLGTTFAEKVEDFGGTNYALGLNFSGWINPELSWEARLNVESLGKNSLSVEKRRGLYMVGVGHDLFKEQVRDLHVAGLIGMIDTMTISEGGNATAVDPYTGVSYPLNRTVAHDERFGYMLLLSKRFLWKELTRNNSVGWAFTPFVSYTDTFARTSYKATTTAAVALELLFD